MNYIQTIEKQVTPLLFNTLSEVQAALVKQVIESFRGLFVIDSYMINGDSELLVIVEGGVGNRCDYIIDALANQGLSAKIASDSEASDIMNSEMQSHYMGIRRDLSSSWD